jgi:hypothetical protein
MQHLDEQTLAGLRTQDTPEIRQWLIQHQPSISDGRGWWYENLAARALQRVYFGDHPAEVLQWARFVVAAAEESVAQGLRLPRDGAIRVTTLAAHLANRGLSILDPNELVARCLSLIEVPFDRAADKTRTWPSLPIEEIRALRGAKNLLNAAVLLADQVTDDALRAKLQRWQGIRGQLP